MTQYFTTPAGHTGITFIASSGDYGYVRVSGGLAQCPLGRRDIAVPDELGKLPVRDRLVL